MSEGLDLHKLRARALLMRWSGTTTKDGCRVSKLETIEFEDKTIPMVALGYYATHGTWAVTPATLHPTCGTTGCVMHLEINDPDDEDIQLVANRRRTRTLGEMFRDGRSRGWFKGGSSYAN